MDQHINDISLAIEKGISKGKKARKNKKLLKYNGYILSLLIVSFCTMVNVSSTFADAFIGIPVIGDIVEFVRIGSGYENVAERGYFTKGDVIYEDDHQQIIIEGYYFSDNEISLIFKGEGFNSDKAIQIVGVTMMDENNQNLSEVYSSYGSLDYEKKYHRGIVDAGSHTGFPDKISMKIDWSIVDEFVSVSIGEKVKKPKTNSMVFSLDKNVFDESKHYDINQMVSFDDVQFDISELEVTPTTMNLRMNITSDTKQFFGFEKLEIIADEKIYPLISNGVVSSGDMTMGYTFYFESFYFDEPQEVKLIMDGFRALDKEDTWIHIDLLSDAQPSFVGDYITSYEVIEKDHAYDVSFGLKPDSRFDITAYQGQVALDYNVSRFGDQLANYVYHLSKEQLNDTSLSFKIRDYPEVIDFNHEVDIKVHQ